MSRQALTITDVCLTMACVAMLAAMLIPVQRAILVPAETKRCAGNLKQLFLAAAMYANDQDGLYPVCPRDAHGHVGGIDANGTAIASLEFLSAYHNGEVGPSSLRCPDLASSGPSLPANPELKYLTGDSDWVASATTASATRAVAYAYDWGAPPDAMAIRVVLADRGHANHRDRVVVAYGDGHTAVLVRATDSATAGATSDGIANVDGSPWHGVYVNRETAPQDNIFTSIDDPPAELPPGGPALRSNQLPLADLAGNGDLSRACVR